MKSLPSILSVIASLIVGVTCQSPGCGKPLPSVVKLGEGKNLTIDSMSGASPRKYRIHVPESYKTDVAVPLILSFHGRGEDMLYQEQNTKISEKSFGFEGIAVYPEGVPRTSGTHPKQWQGDPDAPTNINDVAFALELLDHLQDRYCIDTSRIYASGKSNGGGFTSVLACDPAASSRIAAFAAVAAALYLDQKTQQSLPCALPKSRSTIPVMELHGALDKRANYHGGPNEKRAGHPTTEDIPNWVERWAERDGLGAGDKKSGTLCTGDKEVQTFMWKDTVVHYLYSNFAHAWMSEGGDKDTETKTCAEADATRVILKWFAKWKL